MGHTSRLARRFVLGLALAVALSPVVSAFAAPQQATDVRTAAVNVEVLATREDGPTGGSGPSGAVGGRLAPGKTFTGYVGSGQDGDRAELCTVGGSSRSTDMASYAYQWQVTVSPVAIGADGGQIQVDWKRFEAGIEKRKGSSRVTLRFGESRLLDFVSSTGGDCTNATVRVTLNPPPAQYGVAPVVAYDLWLVHNEANGSERLRHLTTFGRSGETIRFGFDPMRWTASGEYTEQAAKDDLYMFVTGTATSHLLPDGNIELTLRAAREFRTTIWLLASEGTKVVTTTDGEPFKLALPGAVGKLKLVARTGLSRVSARWMTTLDNDPAVDLRSFFEGTQTSLVITARRLQ